MDEATLHFYADDTVMYCAGPSIKEAVVKLQAVFNIIQTQLAELQALFKSQKDTGDNFGYCYYARTSN